MADGEVMTSLPVQEDAEIRSLARRFADTYAELIAERRQHVSEHGQEAEQTSGASVDSGLQRRVLNEPVEEMSWWSLSPLIEADPEAGWAVWERVKAAAADELASGDRAALALCWDDSPWKRAQFLAIRQTFIDEWQARGGIELTLIDQMAQAHSLYLHWIERAHMQASLEESSFDKQLSQRGRVARPIGADGRALAEALCPCPTCAARPEAACAARGAGCTGISGQCRSEPEYLADLIVRRRRWGRPVMALVLDY